MSAAPGAVMSFREHLLELRSRLIKVAAALVVGFFVAWEFRLPIFDFLSRPIAEALADNGIYHFQAIQITESMMVYIKVAVVGDLVLMSPFIFWQLWRFVAPGLYAHEKRFILPLTAFSVLFFLIGAAFAYVVLLPFLTDWLVSLAQEGGNVEVLVTLQNAYSFAFTFLLMFGLVFELPLVLFFLSLWGLATGRGLLKFWRYFVVISFIVAGVLTPPDPLSQTMMAVPLNILYGFGVLVAFSVSRTRAREEGGAAGRALRVMALSLGGAAVVTTAGLLLIASIPSPTLLNRTPDTTRWALGLNPKALLGDDQVRRVLLAHPRVKRATEALATHGVALEDATDALMVSDGALAAFLVRGDGLGERALGLHAALEAARATAGAAPRPTDWVAAAVDADILLVGQRNLAVRVLDAADGRAPVAARDAEDERMLKRLEASGPAWVWLSRPRERGEALLGAEAAADVANAGAVLSLGDRPRLSLHVRATSEGRVAALDAALEAARDQSLAVASDARIEAVIGALGALAAELERLAPAPDRPRVAAIRSGLAALGAGRAGPAIPAMATLAPLARGWSVRQNETWFTLTTELGDEGMPALLDRLSLSAGAP